MSPERNEVVIHHTDEEIMAAIPRPDLPIVYSPFSVGKDGSIAADGGPGIQGRAQMNGHIEDILAAVAPVALSAYGFSRELGPGVVETSLSVRTADEHVRAVRTYWHIPLLRHIGPQEAPREDDEPPEGPRVEKFAIFFRHDEVDDFTRHLKPETEVQVIDRRGYLDRVVLITL